MTRRLIEPAAQRGDLLVELDDSAFQFAAIQRRHGFMVHSAHVFRLARVQWRGTLRAVAINRDRFQAKPPALDVGVHDFVDGRRFRHVHRLRNRAAQEWLRRRHHPEMRHVSEAALAFVGLERAIENRDMLRLESRRNRRSIGIRNIFDRVERVDVRDDAFDLLGIVAEFFQRRRDRLVHDFQHAAAGEQFVFHQRDVGLDPGRVAIHQEADRAGRRENGDLRVAIAMAPAEFRGAIPDSGRFLFQVGKFFVRGDLTHRRAMELNHFLHGRDVVLRHWLGHAAAPRIAIAGERSHHPRDLSALLIRLSGHDRGDRTANARGLPRCRSRSHSS